MERVVLLRVFNGQGLDGEQLWARSGRARAIQQSLKSPNIGDGVDMGQVRGLPYVRLRLHLGQEPRRRVLEQSAPQALARSRSTTPC